MESVRECLDELINPENVEKVLNYLEDQYVDMVLNRIIAITTFMCLPDDVIDMIEKHLDSNDGVAIGFIIPKDSDDDKPDNK